jgi:hypothetical protein
MLSLSDQKPKRKTAVELKSQPASQVVKLVARCDLCSAVDEGTKEELFIKGWEFGPGYQFCPAMKHN